MSLNGTTLAKRVHIGIFGRCNSGKSSVMNALTGQSIAIVSEVMGTTTDPVSKAMELFPIGPVMMIDTPGIDDEGELGEMRVRKSFQILTKTDIAIVVIDGAEESPADIKLIERIGNMGIPYVVFHNKFDTIHGEYIPKEGHIYGSALNKFGIDKLKNEIASLWTRDAADKKIIGDLIEPLDIVVLVVPIDDSAPKGRLILPQQQTIRDILDAGAVAVVVKDNDLENMMGKLSMKPKLVITDSQVFGAVAKIVPDDIMLTSFSILFARYKGSLESAVRGAAQIEKLRDGEKVLISEGCTHHRQCGDIGTVKLPNLLKKYTGKSLHFDFTSGTEFPDDLSCYRLVIHCGGCMLNEREMLYRYSSAVKQNVSITNYGTAIAYMNGILSRSIEPFPELNAVLK